MGLNKKGVSFKILNMALFRLLFISIIFFGLYLFTTSLIRTNIDVDDLRDMIMFNRLLYSKNSISYYDGYIDRLYPGVIDISRFNDDVLAKAFNYSENKMAIKLELTNLESNEVSEAYINKQWYERWAPLTKFEQYDKKIKWRYVLIKNNGQLQKGILRVDMVVANE